MEVGGAGGRGAVVIPEGPGESPEKRCCASDNRHGGREGVETSKCTCVSCGGDLWPLLIS